MDEKSQARFATAYIDACDSAVARENAPPHTSYSLNSFKGAYIGDYIGEDYRSY